MSSASINKAIDGLRSPESSSDDKVLEIYEHAELDGLDNTALHRIIDALIRHRDADQKQQDILIKALIPNEWIADRVIHRLVAGLGRQSHTKATEATQLQLLSWLLTVLDLLEHTDVLQRLYTVLFNLLDTLSFPASLCQVLAVLTRKNHVTTQRVGLLQTWMNESVHLCHVAKAFQTCHPRLDPPLVYSTAHTLRPLSHLDALRRIWKTKKYTLIQCKAQSGTPPLLCRKLMTENPSNGLHAEERGVPFRHDTRALVDFQLETLLEGGDLDPMLLDYLFLIQPGRKDSGAPDAQDVMYRFVQQLPIRWNPSKDTVTLFLDCMARSPGIGSWNDLYANILKPAELRLSEMYPAKQYLATLITLYTKLLEQWRLTFVARRNNVETVRLLVKHTNSIILTLFRRDIHLTQATLTVILDHLEMQASMVQTPLCLDLPSADPLIIYILLLALPSAAIQSRVSDLLAELKNAFEQPPRSWADRVNEHARDIRPSEDIKALNAELMDACNLFLRYQAFSTAEKHANACTVSGPVIRALGEYAADQPSPLELPQLFSLSVGPSFSAFSVAAFRELEVESEHCHNGPITHKSLVLLSRQGGTKTSWKAYRVHVVRWLEDLGLPGISNLARTTMRGLMG